MQFLAAVIAVLLLVIVIKVVFGLLGWVFGNLIALAIGAAIGFYWRGRTDAE